MAMTHDPTQVSDVADPADPVAVAPPAGGTDQPRAEPTPPGAASGEAATTDGPALTWAENEVLVALRRLARARAQLAAAEAQVAAVSSSGFEAADVERLEQVHAELAVARKKASGRRAKGGARQRARELESTERLLLDRLGVASYEEYRTRADRSQDSQVIDSEVIDFARRELDSAQRAWREARALEVVQPTAPAGAEPDIDLT